MKRMTIGIIVIGAVVFGLLFNFVLEARKKDNDSGAKLSKVYKDMTDVNASLNKISGIYIENLDRLQDGKSIYKKDVADSIQINYEKFLGDTNTEQGEISNKQQVVEILNSYYENSGIQENIKNKLKSIRVELEMIKPTNEKEKKLYSQIINVYADIAEYYELIFSFKGKEEVYRNRIIFEKEHIVTVMKDIMESY